MRLLLCRAVLLSTLVALTSFAAEPSERISPILRDLRAFATVGTVLHLAAHPDDENTQLITAFARGKGYRTAYLSLTRGDGGQNERGPHFAEKLGVLRTQELLAARRYDGGRQFFTRAIDYGYSKSPEEALRIWNHADVLGDVVRVIRIFRPDIIITRFPVPPGSGGHGQHTASAMLAVEAFKLAADPAAYPEQLREGLQTWQAKRIGWNGWGNQTSLSGPITQFDIGGVDPVTGEAFGTIANRSRGMHKTQTLGRFSEQVGSAGPTPQNFQLLAGDAPANDIMEGIDTTWTRIPGGAALIPLIDDVVASFNPSNPAASVPGLLAIRAKLDALATMDPLKWEKREDLDRIIAACLGLTIETTIAQAEVVAGEQLPLRHRVTVNGSRPVKWLGVRYSVANLHAEKLIGAKSLKDSSLADWVDGPPATERLKVGVELTTGQTVIREAVQRLSPGLQASHPYWLREEGSPGMFHVEPPSLIGTPEDSPAFPLEFVFEVEGQPLLLRDEPVQVTAGAPAEQARRRLAIIPPVSLGFAHEVELFRPGSTKPVAVEITAARANSQGSVRITVPSGWKVSPASQPFALPKPGDKATLTFDVTAADQAGTARLGASAEIGGVTYHTSREILDYPHLPLQLLQFPAQARATAVDVGMHSRRVGYLPGAGDSIAETLAQLGCEVVTLNGPDLTPEKLSGLDAVVIGVRAFNERADLAANFPGLLAWVERGGTVIAQYNRPNNLKSSVLGPYSLSIDGPAPRLRVTDETAPVTFLAPDHPALNTPNKITVADFEGWVQERGAYFPSKWDEAHYTALLAMNDPDEAPLQSSLLVARHGQGWYVYTGLAFFRQLPAGVPGAQRLFANLVSLGK